MLKRKSEQDHLSGRKKKIVMCESSVEESKKYSRFLLSTVYGLNNSYTKKIIVGLQYNTDEESFTPAIQLANSQCSAGVNLSQTTWTELQNKFDEINNYFESNTISPPRMKIGDINCVFTTLYGIKSIIFDKPNEQKTTEQTNKKKNYTPALVMQYRTFRGLQKAAVCVEERFRRLQRIELVVNQCKNLIVEELKPLVPSATFNETNSNEILHNILQQNAAHLKTNVQSRFNDDFQFFNQQYFDITYAELSTIFSNILHDEIFGLYCDEEVAPSS